MNRAQRRANRRRKPEKLTEVQLRRKYPNAQVQWKTPKVAAPAPPVVIASGWVDDDGTHWERRTDPDGTVHDEPVEMPRRFNSIDDIPDGKGMRGSHPQIIGIDEIPPLD